jgi:hypothetical protein
MLSKHPHLPFRPLNVDGDAAARRLYLALRIESQTRFLYGCAVSKKVCGRGHKRGDAEKKYYEKLARTIFIRDDAVLPLVGCRLQ